MNRAVVSFARLGEDRTVLRLSEAPLDIPDMHRLDPIDVTPPRGDGARERGADLLERLRAHAPVRACIDNALAIPPTGEPLPLLFHMEAAAADELPWEQLYAGPQGFMALDRRWPLARIARWRRAQRDRVLARPFRIVAVLAAVGRSGVPQLEALRAALDAAPARAVDARLHVVSGEQGALDLVAGWGDERVTAEPVTPDLERRLAAAQPDVLHLLCHGGRVAEGLRALAFGTLGDFDAGEPPGGVVLSAAAIAAAIAPCDPWMVVVCACASADASEGPALAHDLVNAGVPAAIGMRRVVDLEDANRFCAALYPRVMEVVGAVAEPAEGEVRELDWCVVLNDARAALGRRDAAADTWSDPILYVQDQPLRVYVPPAGEAPAARGGTAGGEGDGRAPTAEEYAQLRGALDQFEAFRAGLDPAWTPPAVIADVEARISALRDRLAGVGG